jgi:hypothetical protein
VIRLASDAPLHPGEDADVVLVPASPEYWRIVTPGPWIVVKEGGRVIGVA